MVNLECYRQDFLVMGIKCHELGFLVAGIKCHELGFLVAGIKCCRVATCGGEDLACATDWPDFLPRTDENRTLGGHLVAHAGCRSGWLATW